MAELAATEQQLSPSHDDLENGGAAIESRGIKRARTSAAADDDDDDDDKPGRERRKIEIKFIQDKSRRHITFSKRKAGIMKKVSGSSSQFTCRIVQLTTSLGLRTLSPHWHSSPSACCVGDWSRLHIHNTKAPATCHETRGQELDPGMQPSCSFAYPTDAFLQACLNAPEPADANGVDGENAVDSPEEPHNAAPPMPQGMAPGMPRNPQGQYLTADQQQAMQYQAYLQQQQAASQGGYAMPPQAGLAQGR